MPYEVTPPAPRHHHGPGNRFLEFRPPRPWPSTGDPPQLKNIATFEHIHRFRDDRIKQYLERAKHCYQRLHPHIREDLLTANKHVLFACNAEARIDFAHIAADVIEQSAIAELGSLYLVTYAPVDCVFPIDQADAFDAAIIIQRVREAMRGIPFVGMLEAALYKDWGPLGPHHGHDYVSWHTHIITWRVERSVLEEATRALRDRVRDMHERPSVDIRKVRPNTLDLKLLYILKGQIKEYRVNRRRGTEIDQTTGEIRYRTRQQKRWMRTGNHVRMCSVLKDRWLPDLVFGNEAGTMLTWIIRYRAMQSFCIWARAENAKAAMNERNLPYPQVASNRRLGQKIIRAASDFRTSFPKHRFTEILGE